VIVARIVRGGAADRSGEATAARETINAMQKLLGLIYLLWKN